MALTDFALGTPAVLTQASLAQWVTFYVLCDAAILLARSGGYVEDAIASLARVIRPHLRRLRTRKAVAAPKQRRQIQLLRFARFDHEQGTAAQAHGVLR